MIDDDYDLGRYELKYAVKVKHRDEILAIARDHATPDIYAKPLSHMSGALGYTVHSLYFDTPDLLDYTERLSEARIRSRLRIRTYGKLGEDSPLFLENKRKFNDRVIKHRINLCSADSWVASSQARPWRDYAETIDPKQRFGYRNFVHAIESCGRQPMTVVRYEREVFTGSSVDDPKIRLTFDYQVRAAKTKDPRDVFAHSAYSLIPDDIMIMEMKFDWNKPAWMRRICKTLGSRAEPVSKFGLSMANGYRADKQQEMSYLTPRNAISARSQQ